MKSSESRTCPCLSGTWNQVGRTSSVLYEVPRNESLSLSVGYQESCERHFVCLLRSHAKGEHVLVQLVRGIKQAGLRPSNTKSCKEILSTSVRYVESTWRVFVRLIRSHAIGGHIIVCPMRGVKHAGLRPSGTKSRESRACPSPSGTRNQAGWTSSVRYEVVQKEGLSSYIWYKESSRLHFVYPVRSHTEGELIIVPLVRCHVKGELFLIRPVRGIKDLGIRLSGTK